MFCHAFGQHKSAFPLAFEQSWNQKKKNQKKNQCLLHKNKIIMGLNYFGTTFCVLDHLSYVSSVGKS